MRLHYDESVEMASSTWHQREDDRAHLPAAVDAPATVCLQGAIELFQLSRRASCSETTMRLRQSNLERFARAIGPSVLLTEITTVSIEEYRVGLLRTMKPISLDQHDRDIRCLLAWAERTGLINANANPMRQIPRPRIPLPLPTVPEPADLLAVLAVCTTTFEGTRNRAMILAMADAGLRATEMTCARVRDWNRVELRIMVRSGKGRKDRVTFVSPTTADAIQRHLSMRQGVAQGDPLFVDAHGRPVSRHHLVHILHRLSSRAGLLLERRLHPHKLRHFAATSWLRNGMGLDHVRRLLGHSGVSMTLRYSSLVAEDLQRAHREVAVIELLGATKGAIVAGRRTSLQIRSAKATGKR